MTSRILLRRGTAAQWASANPILGSGELGVETDTLKFKIGNGTSTWTQLTSYANITPSDLTSAINGLINAAPSALDTLNELAAAINNDSSFSTTVNNLLTGKVSKSGGDTITPATTSTTGLTLASPVGQTAHLLYASGGTRIPAGGNYLVTPGLTVSYTSDFNAGAANITPIYVKGAASQTANLQEWQNSAGTLVASMDVSGKLIVPTLRGPAGNVITLGVDGNPYSLSISATQFDSYGPVPWRPYNASMVGFIVKGQASQTADLQQWQNSAGDTLGFVDSDGKAYFSHSSTNTNLFGVHGNLRLRNRNNTTNNYSSIDAQSASGIISSGILFINSDHTNSYGRIVFGTRSAAGFNSNAFAINSSGGISTTLMSASSVGLIVKAAASQTANLQEWQNSSGTVLANVDSAGNFKAASIATARYIADLTSTTPYLDFSSNKLLVNSRNASYVGFIVQGSASQTADLQEWQDSAGTALTKIDNNAGFYAQYIEAKNTAGVLVSGESQIKIASPDGLKDIRFWNRNDAGGLYYYNSSGGSKNILRIAHSTDPRIVTQTWQDFTSGSSANYGGRVNIDTSITTAIGMVIRGVASQTANLQEWQDSSGTILSKIDVSGNITAPSYNLSDSKYLLRKTIKKTVDPAQNAVANNTYDLFDMNFSSSLQGTFYIQASIRGGGYGQNLTYSLPATYVMDWINLYPITNPFTNSTTWVDLTPLTFSPRHLMTNDYFKLQAKVNANQISFRIKLTGTLTGAPVFDIYIQHSEEFANSTITELNTTGTDSTTSNVMPNFLSSKAGLSAIFNPITLYSNSASNIPLTIKGFASQSANLQEWQNSSGTVLAKVNPNGVFHTFGSVYTPYIQPASPTGVNAFIALDNTTVLVDGWSASTVKLTVKGYASQTANLQEWQNSAGTILGAIVANGDVLFPSKLFNSRYGRFGTDGAYTDDTVLRITNTSASFVPLIVKGITSQTANLQQWQDSTGTVLAKVDASGNLTAPTATLTIPASGTTPAIVAKGESTYATNIAEFRDTGNNLVTRVTGYGSLITSSFAVGPSPSSFTGFASTTASIKTLSASFPGLIIQGASSQSANLQEWQRSDGFVLLNVSKDGDVTAGSGSSTAIRFRYFDGINITGTYWDTVETNSATFIGRSTTATTMVVRAAASQTANLQEWQVSSGAIVAQVTTSVVQIGPNDAYPARLMLGGADTSALLSISTHSTTEVGAVIRGKASQTADLQQWQNSAGSVVASIANTGSLTTGNLTLGTNGLIIDASSASPYIAFGSNTITINTRNAAYKGLIVKGAASQTANLQEWQSSSGEVGMLFNMGNAGDPSTLGFSVSRAWGIKWGAEKILSTDGGSLIVTPYTTDRKVLIVKGVASQTANLQEWQNSSGTVLTKINSAGELTTPNIALAALGGIYGAGGPYITLNYTDVRIVTAGLSVGATSVTPSAQLQVTNNVAGTTAMIVKAAASQTANLQEWQDSSGLVISAMGPYQNLGLGGAPNNLS